MEEYAWKSLEDLGYPNYKINTQGTIVHSRTGRVKRPSQNQYGTLYVSLSNGDSPKKVYPVATLVAHSFIGIDPERPLFNTVIHRDGDRSNCNVKNLAYRTRSYAIRYHKRIAAMSRFQTPYSYPVESEEADGTVKHFESLYDASIHYGLNPSDIANCCHKEIPSRIIEGLRFYYV